MRTSLVAVAVAAVWLSGCSARQVQVTTRLTDNEIAAYTGAGSCTIKGQAFLKTRGGEVRFGAGEKVILFPDLPILREILSIGRSGQQPVLEPNVHQAWGNLWRTTQADGEGKFDFRKIPCGAWYVESRVVWEVFSNYSSSVQGGLVSSFVQVSPDDSPAKVMLTY